jgi:hypothetical protein
MRLPKLLDRVGATRIREKATERRKHRVAAALAQADRLVRDGRTVEALDELAAANGEHRDSALELRLVELRHEAACSLGRGPGRSPWPPECEDPFPEVVGRLPEIDIADLSAEVVGGAVAYHGGLIVRRILGAPQVARVVEGIHRAERQRDRPQAGADYEAWYRPYPASGGTEARARVGREGGIWLADSPANAATVIDLLVSAGVIDAVAGHLGERPFFSLQKSTLRHSLPINNFTGWHQDGSFLGADVRTINVWMAMSACGSDRPTPGLEIVPTRIPEILSTEGGLGPISVAPALMDQVAAASPPSRPDFEPGDGLMFDERFLHRTYLHDNMTDDRYAVECWLFAPSHASADYLPFLV